MKRAEIEKKLEPLAVRIVSIVSNKVDRNGTLEAYDGIEAAREIRALIAAKFLALGKKKK